MSTVIKAIKMPWSTIGVICTFFSDFQAIAYDLAVRSNQWQQQQLLIQSHPLWGKELLECSYFTDSQKYKSRSDMSLHVLKPQYKASPRHSLSRSAFQTLLRVTKAFISRLKIYNTGLLNKAFIRTSTSITGFRRQAS